VGAKVDVDYAGSDQGGGMLVGVQNLNAGRRCRRTKDVPMKGVAGKKEKREKRKETEEEEEEQENASER